MSVDSREPFVAFITTYALTTGILQRTVTPRGGGLVMWQDKGCFCAYAHKEGSDWHRTLEAVQARAVSLAEAKLKGLAKQERKLREIVAHGVKVVSNG